MDLPSRVTLGRRQVRDVGTVAGPLRVLAPRSRSFGSRTRGIFPFRLTRQPVLMSGLVGEPDGVVRRVTPGDTSDRMCRRLRITDVTPSQVRPLMPLTIVDRATGDLPLRRFHKLPELAHGNFVHAHAKRACDGHGMFGLLKRLCPMVPGRGALAESTGRHHLHQGTGGTIAKNLEARERRRRSRRRMCNRTRGRVTAHPEVQCSKQDDSDETRGQQRMLDRPPARWSKLA